jgi:hypothetical protein
LYDYFLVIVAVFPKWTSRSPQLHPEGHLHCIDLVWLHRTAHTNTMSSSGNGATGASGIGLALGYFLNIHWFTLMFMLFDGINMNTSTCFVIIRSLICILNLLVIFEIKIYRNLPKSLTIQKHDIVDRLSVANFAVRIKPNIFDCSNYKS